MGSRECHENHYFWFGLDWPAARGNIKTDFGVVLTDKSGAGCLCAK